MWAQYLLTSNRPRWWGSGRAQGRGQGKGKQVNCPNLLWEFWRFSTNWCEDRKWKNGWLKAAETIFSPVTFLYIKISHKTEQALTVKLKVLTGPLLLCNKNLIIHKTFYLHDWVPVGHLRKQKHCVLFFKQEAYNLCKWLHVSDLHNAAVYSKYSKPV